MGWSWFFKLTGHVLLQLSKLYYINGHQSVFTQFFVYMYIESINAKELFWGMSSPFQRILENSIKAFSSFGDFDVLDWMTS